MSAAAVSFPPVFVSTRPVETSVASEQEELQATEELLAWCARWSTRCPDSGEMLMARRVSL